MKLKTIAAIFNQNKRLTIYTDEDGEQWVCNGIAAYSMRGIPHLTPEIVLRIFDVPANKHSKWICEESELPTAISFEDYEDEETEIEPLKANIMWFGTTYWLFPDGMQVYSFNEDYIKPLLDESDYLTYYKRVTSGGGFVLACKVGFELKAVIAPVMLKEDCIEEINRISGLYQTMEWKRAVNAAHELYRTHDTADPPPEVDPETGEILTLEGQTILGEGDDEK